MAVNSLHPGFVKIFYTSNGHPHEQVLPCNPSFDTSGGQWLVATRAGGSITWTSAVDAYVPFLQNFLDTASTVNYAELWTEDYPTPNRLFRGAHPIGEAGVSVIAAFPYGQVVTTFRSQNGGLYRNYILEMGSTQVNDEFTPPFTGAPAVQNLATFLTGTSGWVLARDGGYPLAAIRALRKTNDALRKKYAL